MAEGLSTGLKERAPPQTSARAGPRSVLAGLIGSGIQASHMPAVHEREGAAQALAYVYRLIDLDELGLTVAALPGLVNAARHFHFNGLNITHPCKQSIIPFLDELSEDALAVGAVNTVVYSRDGRAVGHNTDCSGFAESFQLELTDVRRDRVVLLGAGGAGAAVAHALLSVGIGELVIMDAEHVRADQLAADLCARFGAKCAIASRDPSKAITGADGLVNATPVGMQKHPGTPIDAAQLRSDLWVAEIIYFPRETELLRRARANGCRTMGGGTMAVFQAAGAFRLFTGLEPDVGRMIRHFHNL
jgi:shikimate dehydrogenase